MPAWRTTCSQKVPSSECAIVVHVAPTPLERKPKRPTALQKHVRQLEARVVSQAEQVAVLGQREADQTLAALQQRGIFTGVGPQCRQSCSHMAARSALIRALCRLPAWRTRTAVQTQTCPCSPWRWAHLLPWSTILLCAASQQPPALHRLTRRLLLMSMPQVRGPAAGRTGAECQSLT